MQSYNYSDLIQNIKHSGNWMLITCINYEECSKFVIEDFSNNLDENTQKRIEYLNFKLISKRTSPFSALELVKDQFKISIKEKFIQIGKPFNIIDIEYPTENQIIFDLLINARELALPNSNLIMDLSALPRSITSILSDVVCGVHHGNLIYGHFSKVFCIFTSPKSITSRNGLGPFSVGEPILLNNKYLVTSRFQSIKTSILVFPGIEGFESRAVIDKFTSHNSSITCAFSCFHDNYRETYYSYIRNQSIYEDKVINNVSIKYYFSFEDSIRLADEFISEALQYYLDNKDNQFALLIAPFEHKWSILLSSYIKKKFSSQCIQNGLSEPIADVIIIPKSQYVSLYSRGSNIPNVYLINK